MTNLFKTLKKINPIIAFSILCILISGCKTSAVNAAENNLPSITQITKPENLSPTPTSSVTIAPTITPIPSPTAIVTPTNTPIPTKVPVKQLTVEELKEEFSLYGSFIGGAGMSYEDYQKAMDTPWIEINEPAEYKKQNIDIATSYTYDKDIRNILINLSQLDGVQLFDIGHTVQDRPIYMIKIDRTTVKNPKTIVLTGSTHARETAGSIYITKQLNDLLNDPNANEYLSQVRIFAVPCVNPDGREGISFDVKNWTYSDGLMWKANANGVDINRNFPGLSWGQIKKGNSKVSLLSDTHTKMYFPGYTAGSEPETKALMKFLQYTIVDEQADILIDYHQQGRIQYAGKPWQTDEQENRCVELAKMLQSFIGNNKTYKYTPEASSYGLRGEGSTLTDYACSLAAGAKFSEKYGFMVYSDGENEYPLITGKKVGTEANSKFATVTLEIGSGTAYLGYSSKTRTNIKNEYTTYHFDKLLYQLFDYIIEKEPKSIVDTFKVLDQKDLPTGCEAVSAAMLLNWYGYKITPTEIVDKYLDTIPTIEKFYENNANENKSVFDYYFVGDPKSTLGKACNAPVIISTLEKFFKDIKDTKYKAINLTGLELEEICKYTKNNTPVLLWISGELTGPTRSYYAGNHLIYTNRHCVVLLDANKDTDTIIVADPMIGKIREWSYKKVNEQFNLYGKQAVVLENKALTCTKKTELKCNETIHTHTADCCKVYKHFGVAGMPGTTYCSDCKRLTNIITVSCKYCGLKYTSCCSHLGGSNSWSSVACKVDTICSKIEHSHNDNCYSKHIHNFNCYK